MIHSRKYLYIGFVFFIVSIILSWSFPNNPRANMKMVALNIPIKTAEGFSQVGIISVALLIVSFIFLFVALKKFRFIAVASAFIAFSILPSLIIYLYQITFASGIDAISYDENQTNCEFTRDDYTEYLQGMCQVGLQNHSNKAVTFQVSFYENGMQIERELVETLMNTNKAHTITLAPKESRIFQINEIIDLTSINYTVDIMTTSAVKVKIQAEGKEREL